MTSPRFATLDAADVVYGRVDEVGPSIRRVIAENPSKFTYHGTGTYIVGRGDVVVIDPGPSLDSHRDALASALGGERVRAVLVTHCHADHSPLAAWLSAETGAPTFAYGPHPPLDPDDDEELLSDAPADGGTTGETTDGKTDESADEHRASDGTAGAVKVEESVDRDFVPDHAVADGEVVVDGAGLTMTAVHTPGHTSNHMCFAFAEHQVLFTGDHVMGWSTTVVSPPDGDMAAYIDSLRKVAARNDAVLWPTHGPARRDAREYVLALVAHRLERERQIVEQVSAGRRTIAEMVEQLYAEVRPELHEAAGRSVLSHLVKLVGDGVVRVSAGDRARLRSHYELA